MKYFSFSIIFLIFFNSIILWANKKTEIVAKILEKNIAISSLKPKQTYIAIQKIATPKESEKNIIKDYQFSSLLSIILLKFEHNFIKSQKISITEEEKAKYLIAKQNNLKNGDLTQKAFVKSTKGKELLSKLAVGEISTWKFNKSLFDKYGGRICLYKGRKIPIDAYEKFFKKQEKDGVLVIYDQELKARFWEFLSGKDPFLKETNLKAFDIPHWQKEDKTQ